ncbi:MAG: MFS transporter [Acidimicrobiales bacterium]
MTQASPPPLPLIFSVTITGILANTLVGPAIPDILQAFDQPDSRAGLFVAAGTLPGIVMAPVIGVLADRFGRRAVLVPCLTAFGAFGLLSALAPTFGILLLLRLLQGLGSAGLINLAVVIIGDHWTGLDRARIVGQNAAVLTVSLAVFPPLGGLLTELGGWRLSFTPYAIGLFTAVLIFRRLDANRPASGVTLRAQLSGAGDAIRHRDVIGSVSIGLVIFMLIFGLFLTTLPVHLEREFGLSAGQRGLVIAAPALTSTVTALRLGWLRARFGVVNLLTGAAVLFTLAFAAIGLAPTLPLLLAGAMLYGLGEGVFIPTLQDIVAEASTAEQRGAVVAVWVGSARMGQTIGPLLASATYGALGTGATFVVGGAVAAGLVGLEAVGRFGAKPRPPA